MQTTRELLNLVQTLPNYKKLWSTFYPRQYKKSDQYGDVRHASLAMISSVNELNQFRDLSSSTRGIILAVNEMLKYDIPTLFLEKDFFASACQTRLPDDATWMDLKFPYEAGLLMLPKFKLKHPVEGYIDFIGYGRIRNFGDLSRLQKLVSRNIIIKGNTDNQMFIVFTGYHEKNDYPVCAQIRGIEKGGFIYNEDIDLGQEIVNPYDIPMTKTDDQFLCQLTQITCQVLSLLSIRPDLVEKGEKVGKSKRDNKSELWTPNVVGRKYRIKYSKPVGTHASPRMHWRRGHLRDQPYGFERKQTRQIWIEPILVNISD